MPRNEKKNVIIGDAHRANKINSNLEQEIFTIQARYLKAGYSNAFIISKIHNFHQNKEHFLI